ncbi:MAG: LamG domain-containing protein [Victivallaceae bacterium]|nr:LamG domain-containing protein [Victivallaceae bacterium]
MPKLKHLLLGGIVGALLLPQISLGADDNVVFKTSFEDDLSSNKELKITFENAAKLDSEVAIHGEKSLNLPEANKRAALRIKGLNFNWKQGAIGFSFKLRKMDWRIFCAVSAQQTDQPGKLGFTISSNGKHFLFGCGNKPGQRAYFRHSTLKPDVWHRVVFSWEVKSGRDALVKCYIDGKQINKKAAVLKNFIPANFTKTNPTNIVLGQYNSLNGPKGFNGYFDAFIIYNTPHTP